MELNEIKKALYKQNPVAELESVNNDGLFYITSLSLEDMPKYVVMFRVPLIELGETVWHKDIEAKLLIRYIIN